MLTPQDQITLVDPFSDISYPVPATKEGNILFNDILNTFYLWLYGYMEHWLERDIAQWVHNRDQSNDPSCHERTLYHGATSRSDTLPQSYISLYITGVTVEHWLERDIAQWVH